MSVVNSIPVLDLADFHSDRENFIQSLGKGYEQWGFCGIKNHGIDPQVVDQAKAVFEQFFARPQDVKDQYILENGGGARGYTGYGVEIAKGAEHVDLKEFWHVGRELPDGHPAKSQMPENLWVSDIEHFQAVAYGLYEALNGLGMTILRAMALYLGQTEDYFEQACDHGNSILRAIHYPPVDDPDTLSVRAAAHEDINLITLLVGSEQAGLEILAKSGEWIPVTTIDGVIICNIGDMMQRLTNHVLPSTTHRVVNPEGGDLSTSRYSIPFFLHPNPEFLIKTLSSCVDSNRPNRYPEPITANGYLHERLKEIGLM